MHTSQKKPVPSRRRTRKKSKCLHISTKRKHVTRCHSLIFLSFSTKKSSVCVTNTPRTNSSARDLPIEAFSVKGFAVYDPQEIGHQGRFVYVQQDV